MRAYSQQTLRTQMVRHRPGGAKVMELNKYEMGVIVRADLDEESQQAEWDRVKGLLDRFNAVIEKEDKWGRRKLAYPIAKQTEGIYTFFTFTAPSSTPREVESRLRLMENVLRFLTINLNDVEDAKAKNAKPVQAEPVAVETPVAVPVANEPAVEATPAEEPSTEDAEQ